jgi:hypothetical protein
MKFKQQSRQCKKVVVCNKTFVWPKLVHAIDLLNVVKLVDGHKLICEAMVDKVQVMEQWTSNDKANKLQCWAMETKLPLLK